MHGAVARPILVEEEAGLANGTADVLLAPLWWAIAKDGLVAGEVPPGAGWAWHVRHRSALNRPPRPAETAHRERIVLSEDEMEKVAKVTAQPRPPTEALRRVMAKRRR